MFEKLFSFKATKPEIPPADCEVMDSGQAAAVASSHAMVELPAKLSFVLPTAGFLLEEQVNPQRLLELYKQAFIEVELTDSNSLRIKPTGRMVIHQYINPDRKTLVFRMCFGLHEEAPMLAKLELANKINNGVGLVRVAVQNASTLIADYELPYSQGVLSEQIIKTTLSFHLTMALALQEYDPDDLVV